jgi:hypothetical protein
MNCDLLARCGGPPEARRPRQPGDPPHNKISISAPARKVSSDQDQGFGIYKIYIQLPTKYNLSKPIARRISVKMTADLEILAETDVLIVGAGISPPEGMA